MLAAANTMGRAGEREGDGGAAALIAENGAALGRVCMALLGDAVEVERALEAIARDAGAKAAPPEGVSARGWIFGLARAACATRISKLPRRGGADDAAPRTERLGAREAAPARARLAELRPTERDAAVLHLVGGLDARDVGVACGVDEATARARIGQAMKNLARGGAR